MLHQSLSLLVHGRAKTGKSTFASTTPAPRCYIDAEGGVKFLNFRPVEWDPRRYAPPEPSDAWDTAVVRADSYDTVLTAYQWLQSGRHPFRSLAVDSISELQQRLVDKLSGRSQMERQQWGELLRSFIGLMRDFRDLTEHPTNPLDAVVLVAMSRQGEDGMYRPWLQGQSAVVIPYLVDVCAATLVQSYIEPTTNQPMQAYRLYIAQNAMYETGERAGGRLPDFIDDPNVQNMINLVFNSQPAPAVEAPQPLQ